LKEEVLNFQITPLELSLSA